MIYIRVGGGGGGGGVSQLHGALFMEDNVLFMTETRHGLLLNTIKEEERREEQGSEGENGLLNWKLHSKMLCTHLGKR